MKQLITLFVIALVIRLTLVAVWIGTGNVDRLPGDSSGHVEIAQNLLAGRGFQLGNEPTSRRGPVFPLFIAPFIKTGWFPVGVQIAHAVLGAVSCVFLFLLGRRMVFEKVGLLASGMFAFDYLLVKQTVHIVPEIVAISLLLPSLYSLYRARQGSKKGWSLGAGILGGLTVLTKESLFYYFPLLVSFFFLGQPDRRKAFFLSAVFLVGFSGTLFPWVVRNRLVHGDWVFLTANTGHVLYQGNNPTVTGRIHGGDWILKDDTDYPYEDPDLPPLLTQEADEYLKKKAMNYIVSHPLVFLKNVGIKAIRLWFPYYSKGHPWTKGVMILFYLLIMPPALYGMILNRKRWREYFPAYCLIFYVTLLHSVTIPSIRYRYSAMPLMMIFAACGMVSLWYRLRARRIGEKIT